MKNRYYSVLIFLAVLAGCTNKQQNLEKGEVSIIPKPSSMEVFQGYYEVTEKTVILVPENIDAEGAAEYFNQCFNRVSGSMLTMGMKSEGNGVISFQLQEDHILGEEGYKLVVDEGGVIISAGRPAGFFYGVQTLLQLLPADVYSTVPTSDVEWKIPYCSITDTPRFEWRGMHLDVSRHFFDIDFIKRYIDLIAMHKMNVFHWHLTDDNGWRIEIKKYPDLTGIAAWRVDREDMPWREVTPPAEGEKATYGGFYTQEEVREVIDYAAKRHITIIPEIEMPGHTSEVFAAYPELSCRGEKLYVQPGSYWPNTDIFCAGKEETFTFIEDVLAEIVELFPAPFVHIGGDEATKTAWKECKRCQKRIKDEGLGNEEELQSWFIRRVEKYLAQKGKKLIGWDEILEGGLAPEATVMSWRGEKGGIEAARMGHDVVMCPVTHCYFDYYQANPDFEPVAIGGFTTLKKVYSYEPVPESLGDREAKYILGAQGNVWTEYIPTPEHAEYMALPRMTALSEVVWSSVENRNWLDFQQRLQRQYDRFDLMEVNYSKGSWKVDILPVMENGVYTIELSSEQYNAPIYYTLDGTEPTESAEKYTGPIRIDKSTVINAALFDNGKLKEYPSTKEIVFHKGIGAGTTLVNPPARSYYAGGAGSLVDGLMGSDNFRDGYWLGFEGTDVDVLIDLGENMEVASVSADFYQNTGAWIFLPPMVTISLLDKDHGLLAERTVEPESTMEVKGTIIEELSSDFDLINARFVHLTASGITSIPDWLEGAGNKGWLFIDEVVVK